MQSISVGSQVDMEFLSVATMKGQGMSGACINLDAKSTRYLQRRRGFCEPAYSVVNVLQSVQSKLSHF